MLEQIYKEMKALRKDPDRQITEVVRLMREYTQKLELQMMRDHLGIETDLEQIYSKFLDSHRVLFAPDDVLDLVVQVEGGYTDMSKFTTEEFETIKEIGIDLGAENEEEFDKKMEEMNEEFEIKITRVHGEEATSLIRDIENKIKKDKFKNKLSKVGMFLLGGATVVAGAALAKKYAPANVKMNTGVDLVLDGFGVKKEDFTRHDTRVLSEIFTAKVELKTGRITGEEYAERFDETLESFIEKHNKPVDDKQE